MRRLFPVPALILVGTAGGAALADCREDLVGVVTRHVTAGPFRVVFATTLDGTAQTTSVEVIPPDRFSFHGIAFAGPGGPVEDGPIIIGRAMWAKDASGWVKMNDVQPGQRNALYTDVAERHDMAENVVCRGQVEREGVTYDAFAFTSTHWIGSWRAVWDTVLHVDPATGLPAIEDVTAAIAGLPDQPRRRMTLTYTYDPSIVIGAPEQAGTR